MSRLLSAGLVLAFALLAFAARPASSLADACTPPVVNKVACENMQTGADPRDWEVDGAGDPSIQGFATQMSVQPGDTISFKIKSATAKYHVDILRLGYYGGDGARYMAQNLAPTNTTTQPACKTFSDTGLVDCGNWSVSLSWKVPTTAVSGVYIARLKRDDTGGDSQIVFVVRDDSSHSDVVVSTSDATWQAYNNYGGNSLYQCDDNCPSGNPKAYKAAYKVSYNRPLNSAADNGQSSLFTGAEYSLIRFLEQNGYDVSYISSVDEAERGSLIKNHKVFISSGHDEYWSQSQRDALVAARDAGVNEIFFSGNEGFWKTRWEPSSDGSSTPDRTLVTYKDSHFDTQQDPVAFTGAWSDPRYTTAANSPIPANAVTGQQFVVNSGTTSITVPYAYHALRLWRNTAVAKLPPGGSVTLAPNTLGYEWDVDADNGFRPAGSFQVSSTTASNAEVFTDYASTTLFGQTATHNMTMYKAPSGARVFGAGTVQWAWGLSDWEPEDDPTDRVADANMEQATVNLLGDMGSQPATRAAGLLAGPASTDTTAPTSAITSPPSTVADGSKVTLSGTASDTGGVVAGVEVSTDGGTTWHRAAGTTSWTYSWTAHGNPSTVVKTRAVDDSGNLETPGAGVRVNVSCPCSIWGPNVTPTGVDSSDPSSVEVGVKFKTTAFGTISGLRFYKTASNTGTHTGSLWTADGQRLATATFANETASGWQTVTFDSPVTVQPNTTYVASYFAPNGHYAATADYFWRQPAPGPAGGSTAGDGVITALRNDGGTTNGVFSYGASSTFPTSTYGAGNYWVDPIFTPTAAPGAVSNVSASPAGKGSASVTWSAPTSGGAVTMYKVTAYVGSTAQTSTTVTGTPPATGTTITGLTTGTSYTFTVQASNPNGTGPESAHSNAVTPESAVAPSAPTNVAAEGATQTARVTWSAPVSDGDSPITGYTVTPYAGSTALNPVDVGASATSTTVSGLSDGTSYTFKVTAKNAIGTGPAATTGTVVPEGTIFDFGTPGTVDGGDPGSIEVGVRFTPDSAGTIVGIRFYKAAANTGVHTGSLWSSTGTRLAQATFTNETASGWQSVRFTNPVAVTAGTTYVASYFTPSGHYSVTTKGLASAVDNGPLHALADGNGGGNGVYAYGAGSAFPNSTYDSSNYWVDVLYAVPQPGQPSGVTAAEAGSTSATVRWSAPSGGGPVSSYMITPYVGSTAQAPITVAGTATSKTIGGLTTGTTYKFSVTAVNANGNGPESALSNAVTPSRPVAPDAPTNVVARPATSSVRVTWTPPDGTGDSAITGYTVTPYVGTVAKTPTKVDGSASAATVSGLANGTSYTFKVTATNGVGDSPASAASDPVTPGATIFDFAAPDKADSGDTLGIEVGVKFKADYDGKISGLRFYKSSLNTGTHVGSLWSADGTRLAQVTFKNESDSGWQSATFASAVPVTAGTTYVASYYAPNGHYSATSFAFDDPVDNGPLHALGNDASPNGVYAYGSATSFPKDDFEANNYFVDVFYAPIAPGQPTDVRASVASPTSADVSWSAPSSGGPVSSYTATPYIGSTAQTPQVVTGSPPARSATIKGLTTGTQYTFKVQAANDTGAGPASAASNAVTPSSSQLPSAPSGVTASADTKSAVVGWTAPASDGGSAITGYVVTPYVGSTAQTPVPVDGTGTSARITGLTNGTAYQFRVAAVNAGGTGPDSAASDAVTPRASIFELAAPAVTDSGDTDSVELGVKFQSDVAGSVLGVRFYKSTANTGTHTGSLWTSDGRRLATVTFTGETGSGWQTAMFSKPVSIAASTTYVVSYFAPNGHYSVTTGAFTGTAFDNAPLHALANLTGPNGVYAYGSTSSFPTRGFADSNYWVDLLFAPGA